MSREQDYICDTLINYLEADDVGETEPHVTMFELNSQQVICFTVNGHPICYDLFDVLWNGLDVLRVRDNWRQY